jgi:MFS family permease
MLMIGVANGAFGTLAPVFGADVGLSDLHHRHDDVDHDILRSRHADSRRPHFGQDGPALCAAGPRSHCRHFGPGHCLIKPDGLTILFGLISLYGAMSYTLYSITVAHANDYAPSDKFVTVSSGLLLLYGVGTIIGPLLAGLTMATEPLSSFRRHRCRASRVAGYALFRTRVRAAVPDAERENFASTPSARAATPESINLDPRATPDA